jgi:leucyl aminopeptidase
LTIFLIVITFLLPLCGFGWVSQAWAEAKKMNSFLSVARGTTEPCKFLEIHYKGASGGAGEFKPTVALVGKGITFGMDFVF